MKTASELRKTLDEALKPDTSGKTTPMQRLTPFLRELVGFLEENIPPRVTFGADDISESAKVQFFDSETVTGHLDEQGRFIPDSRVSSDAPTQAVPASPTNEPGSASKASA